jgi:hypothetical protein
MKLSSTKYTNYCLWGMCRVLKIDSMVFKPVSQNQSADVRKDGYLLKVVLRGNVFSVENFNFLNYLYVRGERRNCCSQHALANSTTKKYMGLPQCRETSHPPTASVFRDMRWAHFGLRLISKP